MTVAGARRATSAGRQPERHRGQDGCPPRPPEKQGVGEGWLGGPLATRAGAGRYGCRPGEIPSAAFRRARPIRGLSTSATRSVEGHFIGTAPVTSCRREAWLHHFTRRCMHPVPWRKIGVDRNIGGSRTCSRELFTKSVYDTRESDAVDRGMSPWEAEVKPEALPDPASQALLGQRQRGVGFARRPRFEGAGGRSFLAYFFRWYVIRM